MGLMSWLRGRRTEEGGGAGLPADAVRRERFDPSRLPPLQRTVRGPELVSDPGRFEGSLTTRQDTTLGTPLGHLVSPEAPAGLVHGITSAVGGPSTVQRAVEMPLRAGPRSGAPAVPAAVQRVSYGGREPVLTTAGESAVVDLPVRHLVGEQSLVTDAGAAGGPMRGAPPAVQRTEVPPPAVERPRRAPGLGAPMSGLPPTAQREAAAAVPGTRSESVPVSRSTEEAEPEETQRSSDEAERLPDAQTAPLLGDDPLVMPPQESATPGKATDPRDATPAPEGVAGRSAEPGVPTAAPVQRTSLAPGNVPATPSLPVVPLLAERPVPVYLTQQAAPVQRAAQEPVVPPAVPVRWGSAAPRPSPTATVQRTAVPVAVPGREAVSAPPESPRRSPLSAVQRQAGGGPPVPRSRNPVAPSVLSAGSVAVAAGVAQRMADGSVVFGTPPTGFSQPVVQRETETTEPPPPSDPGPDPEPDPGPVDEVAPAVSDPGGGSSPASTPAGHGGGPPVTDELVRALYGPLSRLLKADLRLERERAGFLIDTRH
ncbi:hypothetical protein [Streptomyces sp. NBC_01320]|uniref:hypothetical protein n=1 Tax=Streptomyces sp. NBC_01320 TaxID=2903824 RepID=UPI002E12948C|nr:hypothetical protein OG395_27235 [Streptomyces sp. NBC_01320]